MASTYSSDLKLELMATGENAGTWGDNTNNNLNLIQQAIAGYEAVALTDGGTVALAMTDKTISNARNMVIKFTGTLTTASTVTIPDSIEKFYIFDLSAVTGVTNLTVKTVSGTGFTAGEAKIVAAYSDGTNLNEIALDTLGGTIGTAQIADNAVTTAKISDNQVTTAKISDNQVTTAKISDNQITTAKISDLQVTTAKIADDSVTPDKLSDTTVTPGSYTSASITVDQQGRLTAASSGSAGAGGYELALYTRGPSSGTYTANANANKIAVYMAGGGGSAGFSPNANIPNAGGPAGSGYWTTPITAPFAQPYSVGVGGNKGPGPGGGQGGNATTLTNVGTANAGSGGPTNPSGGSIAGQGSAPGSTIDFTPNMNTYPSTHPSMGGAQDYMSVLNPVLTRSGYGFYNTTGQAGNGILVIYENTGT